MLEKIGWFFVYCIRGGIYALVLILLSTWFIFISRWLYATNEVGQLALMSTYIAKAIFLSAIALALVAAVVWLVTWISDYRSDYLSNWIRKDLY